MEACRNKEQIGFIAYISMKPGKGFYTLPSQGQYVHVYYMQCAQRREGRGKKYEGDPAGKAREICAAIMMREKKKVS